MAARAARRPHPIEHGSATRDEQTGLDDDDDEVYVACGRLETRDKCHVVEFRDTDCIVDT
jgi:hypothetical protein